MKSWRSRWTVRQSDVHTLCSREGRMPKLMVKVQSDGYLRDLGYCEQDPKGLGESSLALACAASKLYTGMVCLQNSTTFRVPTPCCPCDSSQLSVIGCFLFRFFLRLRLVEMLSLCQATRSSVLRLSRPPIWLETFGLECCPGEFFHFKDAFQEEKFTLSWQELHRDFDLQLMTANDNLWSHSLQPSSYLIRWGKGQANILALSPR